MNIIFGIFFLFLVIVFIFYKIRDKKLLEKVTQSNRGTRTERKLVLRLLKSGISELTIFHDLYVKMYNRNYAQIDLVVATKVGLIVFEVKNYKGWIFGTGYKPQWTQVLAYGKTKYRFYNPIMQNNKHIKDLKKKLIQENVPFFSVVVFYGDCVLKEISFVPDGTFIVKSGRVLEVMKIIMNDNDQAKYNSKKEVVRVLKESVNNGRNAEIQKKHIANVNDMLGKHRIFN